MRRKTTLLHVWLMALGWSACGGQGDTRGDDAAPDGTLADAGQDAAADAPLLDASTDAQTIDPRFASLAAAIESGLASNHATAASVAVWEGDTITWVGGFGVADGERAPDEETVFLIGSDAKKLSALLSLQQVEEARLSMDDTVADVLTDLRMPYAMPFLGATLDQLLSHQGGVQDDEGERTSSTTDAFLRDYIYGPFARGTGSMAPPGLFYNYSNSNYSVVGLMTETIAGAPWADIARTRLFEPLGMARTFARKSEVDGNHAVGHGPLGNTMTIGPIPLERVAENAFVRPAGHIWSTPSDQMRIARFLVEGDADVLSDTLREEVTRFQVPVGPDSGERHGHGYGLFVDDRLRIGSNVYDVNVWSHGGTNFAYTSAFLILPDQRFAISILSNGMRDNFSDALVAAITSLVDLPAPRPFESPTLDEMRVDELAGSYFDSLNIGRIEITRTTGLRVSMPDLDAAGVPYQANLTPVSTHVWQTSIEGFPIVLRFYATASGDYLVNRSFVALRSEEGDAPRERGTTYARRGAMEVDPVALRAHLSAHSEGPSVGALSGR